MFGQNTNLRSNCRIWVLLCALIAAGSLIVPTHVRAEENTGKLFKEDYTIGVFLSSQGGTVGQVIDAIKHFSSARIKQLNREGGINGHKVKLKYYDDEEEIQKTVSNVDKALSDERLIAMVGVWNSTRGAAIVDKVGKSGVPFISEISLNSLFAEHKTIFTLTRAVDDETRLFKRFVSDNYKSAAFVGLEGDLYTQSFEQTLSKMSDQVEFASSHWIPNKDELDEEAADRAIAELKEKNPDILCLSIGSARGAAFVTKMIDAGLSIPIFVAAGSAERILKVPEAAKYKGRLYQITDGVPYVDNERLAQLARRADFAGRGKNYGRDAVGYGVRYGDILAMIVKAARTANTPKVKELRKHVSDELLSYAAGKKVFRGLWQDWAFTPDRASAETPLMVWRPETHHKLILSPIQYLNTPRGLEEVPVIYVNLDMIRIFRIDSSDKSFHAEFYFAMTSDKETDISSIEFTNAYRGQVSNRPLINFRQIHGGKAAAGFDPGLKLYKVSGKFMFKPELANFPFDRQQFSISFQPVSTDAPFFIQPPKPALRDRDFDVDGWHLEDEYVGSNQDIISTIQNYVSDNKIIPFYKFNYTWIVKREAVDYYLRVVLPLLFILAVVYFAIFIPDTRFESVVAIQVTALLATIALYLAIPKLDSGTATLSDQIFLVTEMGVAIMIGLSILRVNTVVREAPMMGRILAFVQGIVFPAMVTGLIIYVVIKSSDGDVTWQTVFDMLNPSSWTG